MIRKVTIHTDRFRQSSSKKKRVMDDIRSVQKVRHPQRIEAPAVQKKEKVSAENAAEKIKVFQQKKPQRQMSSVKPSRPVRPTEQFSVNVPSVRSEKHTRGRKAVIFLAVFVLLGIFYAVLVLFGSADVIITPEEDAFRLKETAEFSLPQETVTVTKSITQEFSSLSKQSLNKKASGEITVYNAFNSEDQVLVANTRFQSPAGKIYRADGRVVVPGAKIEDGKIIPSSTAVYVYADESGEEYNISEPTDFTIPGFAGSPRYTKFYGKSEEAITGGFNGETTVVGKREASEAMEQVERSVREYLEDQLKGSIPAGFFILENTKKIIMQKRDVTPSIGEVGDRFSISVEGTTSLVLVKKEDLERKMEEILFEDFPEERNKLELVSYSVIQARDPNFDGSQDAILLQADGEITVRWLPNIDKLKDEILNSRVSAVEKVLQNYESVASAQISFSPSWWRHIPRKVSKIRITIKE